jgi:hypothetical protein
MPTYGAHKPLDDPGRRADILLADSARIDRGREADRIIYLAQEIEVEIEL